ncbi:MAG: glycosyltransferase family 9 protein [Gemmatimonadaceae bacterium]
MAQTWVPSLWKRLVVAALNALADASRLLAREPRDAIDVVPGDVRRILVVELWNIGDVVLTIPFLAQIRVLFPQAKTTLLAQSHARKLLEGTHLVDEFVEINIPSRAAWLTYNPFAYDWQELRRLRRELRERKFDVAFQCRTHIRERVLVALSGARSRVGLVFADRDRLLTDPIPVDNPDRHKIDDWLRLLEPFGGPIETDTPSLEVSEPERRWVADYLARSGVSERDVVIGVHPGASLAEKRWPLDRFHEITKILSIRSRARVLAFVDPTGYGSTLGQIEGVITADFDLRRFISLIERCTLLVCNDSGPMHIAGALGVPTVAIFGFGAARWFSPLGEGHELVGAELTPRHSAEVLRSADPFALEDVSVSQVLESVDRVLARRESLPTVPA